MFLNYMQYSLFGSILTIGAMIGAAMSGRIADMIGRRAVKFVLLSFHDKRIFTFLRQTGK
jgi:MFS family permease